MKCHGILSGDLFTTFFTDFTFHNVLIASYPYIFQVRVKRTKHKKRIIQIVIHCVFPFDLYISLTLCSLLWFVLRFFFSFSENIGVKNPKLFEGDMILSPAQRLAAVKGLDVDKVLGNARGSQSFGQWPGGVLIYSIDRQISMFR